MTVSQWRTHDFGMGGVEVQQAPKGVGRGDGVSSSPLAKGLGRGLCPLPKNFSIFFVENTLFRLFLKSYAKGKGSNPLTPSSVRHCSWA